MSVNVTFVGVGQMGLAMALRLRDCGHEVTAYDVSDASRARASAEGLRVAGDLATAMRGADYVLSSLPDGRILREAWTGKGGILDAASGSFIGIDLSSTEPQAVLDVLDHAAARGGALSFLDAPVSGGPNEARAGTLALMVGGDAALYERAAPVLEVLSATRSLAGGVGAGKAVKLVNNMMSMANIVAAAEAFAVGERFGVAPERLFDILSTGGGRSHHFLKRWPNVLKGDFAPGFKMELGEKDVFLAIEFARAMNQPTPVAASVGSALRAALASGHRGKDVVAVLEMYRAFTGEGADHV